MANIEKQKKGKNLPELPPQKPLPERFKEAYSKTRPYLAISLVVALQLVPFIPDNNLKFSVLFILGISLAFMAGDLSNLIKTYAGEVKSILSEINQSIKEIEDPLHKVAFSSNLESPQVEVARKMYEASVRSANQLKNPTYFVNHSKYTYALLTRIKRMKRANSGKISAACGQKEWEDSLVEEWFNENYDALKHNILISRIFLEEESWKTDDVSRQSACLQMQHQADNGINVRFAKFAELQNIEIFKKIPEGFGFVIFEYEGEPPEVIVHNKPGEEKSVLFDDPIIVSQFISAFNELSKKPYSRKIKSNKQMDADVLLELGVLNELKQINSQVKRLVDQRFSNIQMNFVKWRLSSELKNINLLINGQIPIYALDKFTYLTDIFRHIIEQLNENDLYQTISTVDFWSGNLSISRKCLKATSNALKNGAKIERVIFVDEEKLHAETSYRTNIKKIIELFEAFEDNDNNLYVIKFFKCNIGDVTYGEMLRGAPRALITESDKKTRSEIFTKHGPARIGTIAPQLSLKFYKGDENDPYIDEIESNFREIVSDSMDLNEMKEILYKLT